jgi:hypothetical protein
MTDRSRREPGEIEGPRETRAGGTELDDGTLIHGKPEEKYDVEETTG